MSVYVYCCRIHAFLKRILELYLMLIVHLQDANVFVSEADASVVQNIELGSQRQAYLICIEGDLKVNEVDLSTRDAVEIVANGSNPFPVCLTAGNQGSHFLFIEMQKE